MKIMASLFVACSLILSASAFSADPAESAKAPTAYINKAHAFSIDIPAGWAELKDIPGVDAMFTAPVSNEKTGGSQANLNVISGDIDADVDVKTFYDLNLKGLPQELGDFAKEAEGTEKINGLDAYWVRYLHKVGDLEIRVLQYFFVVNGKGYVVTFSAIGDAYNDYAKIFEETVKTFKIENN